MPIERICGCQTCKEASESALKLAVELSGKTCPIGATLVAQMAGSILISLITKAMHTRDEGLGLMGKLIAEMEVASLTELMSQATGEQLTDELMDRAWLMVYDARIEAENKGDIDVSQAASMLDKLQKRD